MHIKCENLHKSFGDNHVLKGVSLDIEENKVTVIIGGSGTGKSVLLKHICGLLKPDKGSVFVDNQDISKLSERKLFPIRQKIGYIFQSGGLLASLNVFENVALGLSENRIESKAKIKEIVLNNLKLLGLDGKEKVMPANLSGGMRKRVAIARALTMKPDVVLYDEPTAGLDPPMSENIDNLIKDLDDKTHVTSVVVTHDLISVFNIAHIVYMLNKGELIFKGSPEELKKSEIPEVKAFISRK